MAALPFRQDSMIHRVFNNRLEHQDRDPEFQIITDIEAYLKPFFKSRLFDIKIGFCKLNFMT
jgi:hypothetical protein